jgi:DNA-binding MarR family transcriptional regulator
MRMSDNDSKSNKLDISDVDTVIHQPMRLSILAHLFILDSADALFLKNQIGLTWGNLSTHMKKLEDEGFIQVEKTFVDRKPLTTIKLTDYGRKAFKSYSERMSGFFSGLAK